MPTRRDDAELAAIRSEVERAISKYVRRWVQIREESHDPDDSDFISITEPIVEGFTVATSVTSTELAQADMSLTVRIMPNDQPRVVTLGLLWEGARDF